MSNIITAQELKTKGAALLTKKSKMNEETYITVRGEKRFVVLTIDQYAHLKECELEAAWKQTQENLATGAFNEKSPADHLKDLQNV